MSNQKRLTVCHGRSKESGRIQRSLACAAPTTLIHSPHIAPYMVLAVIVAAEVVIVRVSEGWEREREGEGERGEGEER